jgi:arabinose-5-phosphate isomerase
MASSALLQALGGETIAEDARNVIIAEAAALGELAAMIDSSFVDAINLIMGVRGRVVVTGMGKSGHVGRKIAATLAATGTPATFVHPAEAAHGDLGMMMQSDMLLALSNSGRTPELEAIVSHAQRLRIPIVAIASQPDSWLMRDADVPLLMPQAAEACPANLAPTTSTMMMMALGDALAISAMKRRGFSRQGFQLLHPGGQIGARLRQVGTLMHRAENMPLVSPDCTMPEVILTMTSKSFGIAGVVDSTGLLIGVITDGDLRRHADGLMEREAGQVMTLSPITIEVDASAEDALEVMNQHRITGLFVVAKNFPGAPVGIVHIHDFLRLGIG